MINNNDLPLVLYGAGRRAPLGVSIMKNFGLSPICICDADTDKQDTEYLGLPVLSIAEAFKRYGKFNVFVTVGNELKYSAFDSLLEYGIDKNRILNYVSKERYRGCPFLFHNLTVDSEGFLRPCDNGIGKDSSINVNTALKVSIYKNDIVDIGASLSLYIDNRKRAINAIKNGEICECTGCSAIKEDLWKDKLKTVSFGFCAPCNLSCIYCSNSNIGEGAARLSWDFDVKRFINKLNEQGLLDPMSTMHWASGEITINQKKREILDALGKYRCNIACNCVIFDAQIAKLNGMLCPSIDAGTHETYKRIKGIQAFDDVWRNIKKYIDSGLKVAVKYIFISENSNEADIIGFIKEATKADVKNIIISAEYTKKFPIMRKPCTEEQFKLMAKMYNMAKRNGISTYINETFTPDENNLILDYVKIFENNVGAPHTCAFSTATTIK